MKHNCEKMSLCLLSLTDSKQLYFRKTIKAYKSIIVWFPVLIIMLINSREILDHVLLPKFILLSGFLLVLAFVMIFRILRANKFSYAKNHFFKIYFFYALISGLSLLYTSNLTDGIFEFQKILIVGFLVYLVCMFFSDYNDLIKLFVKSMVLLNLIIGFVGLFELTITIISKGLNHELMYNIKASFAHKNIFSEILFLCLPFSFYAIVSLKSWWKYSGIISSFFSLFLITLLLSRAVWLAVMVSFSGSGLLLIYLKNKKKNILKQILNKRSLIIMPLFFISVLTGILFYSKQDDFSTFRKQTEKIVNFNYGSTKDRIQLWKNTFEIIKENTAKGIGLASWKIEILKYGNRNLRSEDQVTFYQRPHNDFIWVFAEQGLLGLLLYIGLFISILWQLKAIIFKTTEESEIIFFTAIFFAIIGYLTYSLFSFPKERIEHGIILSFVFSIVIIRFNSLNKSSIIEKKTNYLIPVFVVIIIALFSSVFVGLKRYQAESHTKKAFIARSHSNWNKVISEIDFAESKFYTFDPFSTPLAWYTGSAYFNQNKHKKALQSFKKSYKLNPYHIHVLNNLGTSYEIIKQHDSALFYFNEALKISSDFEDALFNKCAVEFNMNKKDKAYATLRKVNASNTNKKYKTFLKAILIPKINSVILDVDEDNLLKIILSISKTEDWLIQIHNKSVKDNRSFELQLIYDAIYTLQHIEKTMDEKEAKEIKQKYDKLFL